MTNVQRRDIILAICAAGVSIGCQTGPAKLLHRFTTLTGQAPIIIAHRGASGHRPEHTLSAYRLGIDMGADFTEPDLVLTKDGHLVCRHENEIGGTTDVSLKPEFSARKTVKIIDGERFEGWFTEDFTLAELKTLRCKERLPQLRPTNMVFDGQDEIPTFDELLALLKGKTTPSGKPIGVYPETKHPSYFDAIGLSHDSPLVLAIKNADLDRNDAAVFVQSFEVGNLKRLSRMTKARLIQLVSDTGNPPDRTDMTYADMLTPAGLRNIASYAAGIGPQKTLIIPRDADGAALAPTDLVTRAHAANLAVHPWTFRAENFFLPKGLRRGDAASPDFMAQQGDLVAECQAFLALGVDGLFADHPAMARLGVV